ncbi:MAG: 4Fe-4S binding protein [Coprococcus sp.]
MIWVLLGNEFLILKQSFVKDVKKCSVEAVCPMGAAKVSDKKLHIDENVCIHCGRCVGNCRFDSITDGTYGFKIFVGGRWGEEDFSWSCTE